MAKVMGLGGVFFKSEDPKKTAEWMTNTLEVPTEGWGRSFDWRYTDDTTKEGQTVLGLHKASSDYFGPSKLPFMLNFIVDDLDGMLAMLEKKGVEVIKRMPDEGYGRFAHIAGPDDITIELWEPTETKA